MVIHLGWPLYFFLIGVLYSAKKGGVGRNRLIKSIEIPICAHSERKLREKSAESFEEELQRKSFISLWGTLAGTSYAVICGKSGCPKYDNYDLYLGLEDHKE